MHRGAKKNVEKKQNIFLVHLRHTVLVVEIRKAILGTENLNRTAVKFNSPISVSTFTEIQSLRLASINRDTIFFY